MLIIGLDIHRAFAEAVAWPRRHAARSAGGVRREAVAERCRGDRGHRQTRRPLQLWLCRM